MDERRGIFHSSCRHSPAPDAEVDCMWNSCRGVDDWQSPVSSPSGRLVGAFQGPPAEEAEPHCLRHQTRAENFRRHQPRPKLRLSVGSQSSRSFQGALIGTCGSFGGCWAHRSCPQEQMVTGFVDVGRRGPGKRLSSRRPIDRGFVCAPCPRLPDHFPKCRSKFFSLFLAVDPARKPTHC
jgi:hypothetical protein